MSSRFNMGIVGLMRARDSMRSCLILSVVANLVGHSVVLAETETPPSIEVAIQDAIRLTILDSDHNLSTSPEFIFEDIWVTESGFVYDFYVVKKDDGYYTSSSPPRLKRAPEDRIPRIHARLYVDDGFLRYDLLADPGADIAKVKLQFKGADGVWVNSKGELVLETTLGTVTQRSLMAYQVGQ